MKAPLAILVSLVALAAAALTENFDLETGPALPAGWKADGTNWAVRGGALWKRGPGDRVFAVIEKAGTGSDVIVEANVTVRRREGTSWGVAGVAIRQDASNFWHLAIVEAPVANGGTHYVELLESLDGVRNAQSAEGSRLKVSVRQGDKLAWEMDKPYRFRLVMRDGKIEGTVGEPGGEVRARIGYEFTGRVVTSGTPAVVVSTFVTVFDDIKAEVAQRKTPGP